MMNKQLLTDVLINEYHRDHLQFLSDAFDIALHSSAENNVDSCFFFHFLQSFMKLTDFSVLPRTTNGRSIQVSSVNAHGAPYTQQR